MAMLSTFPLYKYYVFSMLLHEIFIANISYSFEVLDFFGLTKTFLMSPLWSFVLNIRKIYTYLN